MPNGKEYVLFYLKLLLESISHSGELRFTDTIPYNEQMLATVTNTNIDIVRSAMKVFTELNMLEVVEDGTIYMSEVEKMIGSMANNPNANRQRRFRENHSSVTECNAHITESVTENNAIVTECNAHITESVTNNNESKRKSKSKRQSKSNNIPPTLEEVSAYCEERHNNIDPQVFIDFYESKGWYVGKNKMKDWKACIRTWEKSDRKHTLDHVVIDRPSYMGTGYDPEAFKW
jgi:predicted phage replisome organizer